MPSGRVGWATFVPLSIAAAGAACAMAYLLYLVEAGPYVFVLTPLVIVAPVLAAVLLAVYVGKCRNVWLAGAFGVGAMALYYLGYWMLSYVLRVVAVGPAAVAYVTEHGGAAGPAGYFLFRCRIGPNGADFGSTTWTITMIGLRGLELGILLAVALYAARRLASRVFYDEYDRWASSSAFLFDPNDLPLVCRAVEAHDWALLDTIEKRTPTKEARRLGGLVFRIEFLPRTGDLPVYVTVEGARLRRLRWLLLLAPVLGRFVNRWVQQRPVPPALARELARHVGGLDLEVETNPMPATSASAADGTLPYWPGDRRVAESPHGGALTSMLREAGYAGATLVGSGADFRDRAAAASLAIIGTSPDAGIDGVYESLCYPADPDPLPLLKRLSVLEAAASFAFLGTAAAGFVLNVLGGPFISGGDPVVASAMRWAWVASWLACGATLAFMILGKRPLLAWMLRRRFRGRRGSLLLPPRGRAARPPAADVIRVEDPATFHVSKLTPEDWGLCIYDAAERRLLVEGVSHRYLIWGRDVTCLAPLVSGASQSVRIDYRVAGEPFSIVLNRYVTASVFLYAFATLPILNLVLGPYARGASARFARRVAAPLGLSVSPAWQPEPTRPSPAATTAGATSSAGPLSSAGPQE